MISVDASGAIRLSSQLVKSAGFRPGQSIAVVAEGKNSFSVVPATKVPKNTDSISYSVELDGRVRVSKNALASTLNVRGKKKNMAVDSRKGSITVSL